MLNRFCLLIIITALYTLTSCKTSSTEHLPSPIIPANALLTGDIAFRMGHSIESRVIAAEGSYSHIGVVLRSDTAACVVHIEPERNSDERTRYSAIEEFFHPEDAQRGAILRLDGIDSLQRMTIKEYLLGLSAITFDHDYALGDTTRMYCTELVWNTFKRVNIDLSQGIRHSLPLASDGVILPGDIQQHPALKKIWSYDHNPNKE